MTQADPALANEVPPESFLGVVFRRTRYAVAIVLAAWLFCTLGWRVAAPPADWGGVSLLAWSTSTALTASITIAALLLLATAISTLLVHPDTPHMGLCCALMGLAGLSIRGGAIYMLIRHAELAGNYREISHLMAAECFLWATIFLVAEILARGLHDRFFANTRWLTRTGVDLAPARVPVAGHAQGYGMVISMALRTHKVPRPAAIPLALIVNCLVSSLLLYCFLHAPSKGQVFFACFAAFFIATNFTYFVFQRVPALVYFLTVPVTAAVGYLFSANYAPNYPGHAGLFFGYALPIDYISAGIPGAIFGFYLAFHWDLHSRTQPPA